MEKCSFQSQMLSIMEVLAKAAVAEINRQVDDRCAVIRLEVSQSRRDINVLRRKCEVMEAELRRSRMRARRKVKGVSDTDTHRDLGRQVDAEAANQRQQRADADPGNKDKHMQIKEERAEGVAWKTHAKDKLNSEAEQPPCPRVFQSVHTDMFAENYQSTENPADPGPAHSSADSTFPEQQLNRNQSETEIMVKYEKEEEPDENAAPFDSDHRCVNEEGNDQLWSSRDADDSSFSYAGQQYEQVPSVFTPQSGLHSQDAAPRIHLNSSAARMTRQDRLFVCKRTEPEDGHSALAQINSIDRSLTHRSQHPCRQSDPRSTIPDEDLLTSNPAASPVCGHSAVKRMRTPWMPGLSEKKFSCTYCDRSFMRFSQLKEHLRSHTGEKPFSCLQCGRSFTKQCNLIRHAVVHSGEKPYECSLCGKCFTQRSSLKSHQKTAH